MKLPPSQPVKPKSLAAFLWAMLALAWMPYAFGAQLHAAHKVAAKSATTAAATATAGRLEITVGNGTLVRLNEGAQSVFVADPTVADVHVPSPRTVFVFGKKAGTTTLYALGANDKTLLQRTLVVGADLRTLHAMIAARFPDMHLRITAAPGSLLVSGPVRDASDADAVVQMITPYLADKQVLINRMTIDHPLQVLLRVRITEVDRNVVQQLGINWSSLGNVAGHFVGGVFSGRQIISTTTNSNGVTTPVVNLPSNSAFSLFGQLAVGRTDIQLLIDALNQEGLMTTLAEPNLVALSGETASFLAGGEFPIPISQPNGGISVTFKQFGVKLNFTPTVLGDHRISLKVSPEVSQLDTANGISTGGVTIPGLDVRRADTTVELGSGQSFAIGGLLQSNTSNIISQLPGLGSIPILGKLFSSSNYQNNKTELVIIATPYLVDPTEPSKLRSPIDSVTSVIGDVEYGFQHSSGNVTEPPEAGQPRLVGSAGYIY